MGQIALGQYAYRRADGLLPSVGCETSSSSACRPT
jgi:hypothetical protein